MKYILSVLAMGLTSAATVLGGIVIEQSEITGEADYGTGQGQSFLLPAGATAAAIQLHIGSVGNDGGSVNVRLWEATGAPGSYFSRMGTEPVATGTLDRSDISDTPGWFTIPLDQPYINQEDHPVYLVFEMELLTSGGEGWNNYNFSDQNSYNGGHSVSWTGNQYAIQDGEDLTFRILDSHTTFNIVVEQNEITGEADYETGQGQSFLLPAGATAAAIQLHIGSVGNGGGSVAVRLWEATGAPGSYFSRMGTEPVATGTLDRSDVSDTPGWCTILLDEPYINQEDTPVYLVFEMELLTSGGEGWNNYSYSDQNSYNGGHLVYWQGSQYVIQDGEDLTFRILDEDPGVPDNFIAFSVSSTSVNEGEALDIEIQVAGEQPAGLSIDIEVEKLQGAGSDVRMYEGNRWIDHPGGTSLYPIGRFYVADDKILNGPTVYRIHMQSDSPHYTVAPPGYIDITIVDDEVPGMVFFDKDRRVLHEGGESTVVVRRPVHDPGTLEVRVESQPGTAVEGSDYEPIDGFWSSRRVCIHRN